MSSEYNNICHINAIPEQSSKGIKLDKNDFFAVKSNGAVTVYYNSCPHLGSPLQWQSDQFLNHDKSLILCSTHGALFIIESGLCLVGPCQNQSLTMADFYIEDGQLYLKDI